MSGDQLRPDQVLEIRAALSSGEAEYAVARRFAVTRGTIGHINTGRTWRRLDGPDGWSPRPRVHRLVRDDIPVIRDLLAKGIPHPEVAERFDVSDQVIYDIDLGRTWRSVP